MRMMKMGVDGEQTGSYVELLGLDGRGRVKAELAVDHETRRYQRRVGSIVV